MTNVSRASIENYYLLVYTGERQRRQDRIMNWILRYHEGRIITRHVIAKHTGIVLQTVCGGVNRLIKSHFLNQDKETIPDPVTTNPVHRLRPIIPQPVQRTFEWPT